MPVTPRKRPAGTGASRSGSPPLARLAGRQAGELACTGMTWQPELDELRRRQQLAGQLGGPDKVSRQHEAGRLTSRFTPSS